MYIIKGKQYVSLLINNELPGPQTWQLLVLLILTVKQMTFPLCLHELSLCLFFIVAIVLTVYFRYSGIGWSFLPLQKFLHHFPRLIFPRLHLLVTDSFPAFHYLFLFADLPSNIKTDVCMDDETFLSSLKMTSMLSPFFLAIVLSAIRDESIGYLNLVFPAYAQICDPTWPFILRHKLCICLLKNL